MVKGTTDKCKKPPRKTTEFNSDSSHGGSYHGDDRKLPAATTETFDSLQMQKRRRQRREAYSHKLSEILNRIHKTTPCSAATLDNNKHENKEQVNEDISGPQYTFDNYEDGTAVDEDFECNNRTEQLKSRSIFSEGGPVYILERSEFCKEGEKEVTGDNSAILHSFAGEVCTVESHTIKPAYTTAHGERTVCGSHVSFDNAKPIDNRSICQNSSFASQQHDEQSELYNRPGAVAVGSDSLERFRSSIVGTRIYSGWGARRLQNPDPTQFNRSNLTFSVCSNNSYDSKEISSTSASTTQLPNILPAYRVEDCDVESARASIEGNLNSTPVVAEVVDNKAHRQTIVRILSIGLALVAGIVVMVVLIMKKNRDQEEHSTQPTILPTLSPGNASKPTMETVLERGVLKCGVPDQGLAFRGFEIDSCRAVAAAVMGANYDHEAVTLPFAESFTALANGSVALLASGTTYTMERDVYKLGVETGFAFSAPYLYDGLGFGGQPHFVECADTMQTRENCSALKICVTEHSTHHQILADLFPSQFFVASSGSIDSVAKFINGECNVIADEKTARSEQYVRSQGYTGKYTIGKYALSKEPLAIVTRDDDHEWSQVVNWVLQAQFLAEAMNITQDTAGDFSIISPFGDKYNTMFSNAITAVGNYGERYERYFEMILPREGMNRLYLGNKPTSDSHSTNGLIFSYPFGPINNYGPEPTIGSRLNKISERSVLRCGITEIRDGFARFDTERQEWKGLDIDYCNVIAAAMFGGVVHSTVEYVNLTTKSTFNALINYDVDVVCGVDIDIEANIEMGISFSQPYFYEGEYSSRSLATYGKDDPQFSDFVWWVVTATFFAEEENITRSTSNDMPEVNLFGPRYHRMFRDAILITGNYGNLYEKNLGTIIPRSGRNNLNNPMIGPQINPNVGF